MMTLRPARFSILLAPACALSLCLGASGVYAQSAAPSSAPASSAPASSAPASPFGGEIVEQAVARVNDQIITTSDYDRTMKEIDNEARQRGASMQQIAEGHKDLLRNLIDQQLWISKGKELDVNVETEVIKQLDEIRKKYNLETMEDLEKAAREQGFSYEDFKANIRNQLVTQTVMRQEVGRKVAFTPGEAQRYYDAHKQDYAQPESVRISEILVATPTEDTQTVATAKAKADDTVAKLRAGGNFDQIARSSSQGSTAAEGGDMGKFVHGGLAKVFEDATFDKPVGTITDPIRTKQGYVIFKVTEHNPGGAQPYKDVETQVEDALYNQRMEPAIRTYLNQMREEAYIVIRPGYTDSAATPNELKPTISYSSYTPPAPKKKQKAERTRFRETEHSFRSKTAAQPVKASLDTTPASAAGQPAATPAKGSKSAATAANPATMKPGKKEKIRYGQAPRETLPNAAETKKEDAGALPETASSDTADIPNPLEQKAAPTAKSRYSDRAKLPKEAKPKGPQLDTFTPAPADSQEVADRQTQAAPLGLNGDATKKKKKKVTATTGEKTRMQERPKDTTPQAPLIATPAAPAQGAPAPKPAVPGVNTTAPVPSSFPQQTPTSPDPPQSDKPATEPPH